MNSNQRKYAVERVSAIKNIRRQKLDEAHRASRKTITDADRAELIRKGKVKLRDNVTAIHNYTDVTDVFDFSKFEGHTEQQTAAYQHSCAALESEAASIKDQIMLGDAEEALKLLSAFSEG